jgi:hypothetical protein
MSRTAGWVREVSRRTWRGDEMKVSLDKGPTRQLITADLCDHCSAPAKVETVMLGGSLLWCAHHLAFFEDALDNFGATILVYERLR